MTAFQMMDASNRKQTSKVLLPTGILYNYMSWVPLLIRSSWGVGNEDEGTKERKISAKRTSVLDKLHDRHLSSGEEELMAT
jgi:hypothetical protein